LFSILNTAETHEELKKRGIKWYHNPERSPSKGGHIERLIGVAKKPLLKALVNNKYTESEFNTLLTSVEAASNLRPLSPISQSPDDHNMLCITPSHLMIGQSLKPLPSDLGSYETENRKMKMSAIERYEARKNTAKKYWELWSNEYVLELRALTKDYMKQRNLKVGDYVLFSAERINKLSWPVGVICKVYPSSDGKIRSVEIRLPLKSHQISDFTGKPLASNSYKTVKRGINQISLLEEQLEATT